MGYHDKYRAAWVVLPNTYFDPKKGHDLYNRYLDELELAAELGFDGISVNEHHQNAYGLMPSPVVMASALARRTTDGKIAILGNAFCLREHPLTLAEEHAMLDCITGGRLITGMVRGIGAEYYSMGVNPAHSHARFQEAHDLVVQAWTKPGPFASRASTTISSTSTSGRGRTSSRIRRSGCPSTGSHRDHRMGRAPHAQIRLSAGLQPGVVGGALSQSTIARSARRDVRLRGDAPIRSAGAAPIYVAETDEQARREAGPHIETMFNVLLRLPFEMMFPPGYLSAKSLANMRSHKRSVTGQEHTVDSLIEAGIFLCGSPDTVRKQLTDAHRQLGFQNLLCLLQFATLPADLTEKNIRLFASEVMPALQQLTDDEYVGMPDHTLAGAGPDPATVRVMRG